MKKFLLAVLVVLVLALLGGLWFWRSLGPGDYAKLLPANTVAVISVNDLPRSAIRWPQTTLAKIGAEPQVTEFLKKPLQYMTKDRGGDEATNLLLGLKPVRIFAAIVSLSSQQSSALVGFQFWGGGADYDRAIARLRLELDKGRPAPAVVTTESYKGDVIAMSTQGALTLYTAHHGKWGFLSNNGDALKEALDRTAGRDGSKSLADSEAYKATQKRLPGAPDVGIFLQPQTAIDSLLAVGAAMGAQAIPAQVAELKKLEAIGASLKIDGENLHDSLFVLRPDAPDIGTLKHDAVKFTSPKTTIYFDFLLNVPQLMALGTANPAAQAFLQSPMMQNSHLPTLVPEAFGPECAVSLTWGDYDFKPHGIAAVQIKDQAKADAALQDFLSLFPQAMITEKDGLKMYNFPSLQGMFTNPTFAYTNGFLIVGMDATDIDEAVADAKAGQTLEKAPDFSFAAAEYREANEVFGYVDSKKIVTRGYPLLRQVMIFGAAVMPASLNMIDASKLPETETLTRHLAPIVYTQTRYADGYLIESKGPITLNQAVLAGTAAAFPFLKPSGP